MRWRSWIARLALSPALIFATAGHATGPKLLAFYAPWDQASLASLQMHADEIEAVVPAWISVTGPDHKVTVAPDPAGRAALAAFRKPPQLWIMVQNALLGSWDGQSAAALFHDRAAMKTVLDQIEAEAVSDKAKGLVFDFEDLASAAQPDLLAFMTEARERCRRHGWVLASTAPVANPDWNLSVLAKASDRLILMAYDEHWQSGAPGPIASSSWFASTVRRAAAQLPPAAASVAIASYAYDWPTNGPATILSIPQAEALAAQVAVSPQRDAASGAMHFAYVKDGVGHDVWMSDAETVREQISVARAAGARWVALWRLGTEDPKLWERTQ